MSAFPAARHKGGPGSFALEIAFLVIVACGLVATVEIIALHLSGGYATLAQDSSFASMDRAAGIGWAMLLAGPALVTLWCLRFAGSRTPRKRSYGMTVDDHGLHRTFEDRDPHTIEWQDIQDLVWNRSTDELEVRVRDSGSGSGPIRFDLNKLRGFHRRIVSAVEKHSGRAVERRREPRGGSPRSVWTMKKVVIVAVVGLVALVGTAITVSTWSEGLDSGWVVSSARRQALSSTLGGMMVGPLCVGVFALVLAWALSTRPGRKVARKKR